ncbi:MAG: TRAP transporter permease [Sporomusaceae bacterium]|nr:TRAP transporter permease [Sporomusaceae bacterium]
MEETREEILTGWRVWAERGLAVAVLVFQLMAMSFAMVPVMVHRLIFLSLCMLLVCLKPAKSTWEKFTNWTMGVIMVVQIGYVLLSTERITTRIPFIDDPTTMDLILGVALIAIIMEVTRRVAGLSLAIIVAVFMAYGFLGPWIPGPLGHRGADVANFIDNQVLSPGGIFGQPIGAVIAYVFYFVLFTAFLEVSGGGKLFIDFALRIAGWARGGPAKAAVIASGAMGTISGSAVANVVGVGAFTIPLMKRTGFAPHVAGGIEAAASTGGQLMPPVMGAAAFVMAEITGISYFQIALAAAIPAVLYYLSIFFQVDFYAQKTGLKGIPKADLPNLKESVIKYGHLMIPLGALVVFMGIGNSLMAAGLKATVMLIVLSFLRKETRMLPMKCLDGLVSAIRTLPSVAVPCAAAGIIIGVVISTNLGLQFSSFFLAMAAGNQLLTLIAIMGVCIILGMGMPTISAYIIVVLLMVPTVIQMGIPVLAAHMFVFYFALLSFVTPPVALAAYTASGIAQADAAKTGWLAFQFTLGGFIIPFIIANDQALLMQGPAYWIIWRTIISVLGIYVLGGAAMGWYFTNATAIERVLGVLAAILLVIPLAITDYAGLALCIIVLVYQYRKARKLKNETAAAEAPTET